MDSFVASAAKGESSAMSKSKKPPALQIRKLPGTRVGFGTLPVRCSTLGVGRPGGTSHELREFLQVCPGPGVLAKSLLAG